MLSCSLHLRWLLFYPSHIFWPRWPLSPSWGGTCLSELPFPRPDHPQCFINSSKLDQLCEKWKHEEARKIDARKWKVPSGISLLLQAFWNEVSFVPFLEITSFWVRLLACRLVQNVMACHSASWPHPAQRDWCQMSHLQMFDFLRLVLWFWTVKRTSVFCVCLFGRNGTIFQLSEIQGLCFTWYI